MRIKMVGVSGPFTPEKVQPGVERLRARGYVVDDRDLVQGTHAYLNGDDDTRVQNLEAALNSDVDVVWIARGGYGITRILERLQLPERLPVIVGFSDVTALFCALHDAGKLTRGVHGPLGVTIAAEPQDSFDHSCRVVEEAVAFNARRTGDASPPVLPMGGVGGARVGFMLRAVSAVRHDVEGPLFAANACVLAALSGTPFQPNLAGHVLFLEEIGERPYRLDRILTQLLSAGTLQGVRGVVVGHLTNCTEPPSMAIPGRDPSPSALDVVVERLSKLHDVPVFAGAPFGHEPPNWALPLGRHVRVSVDGDITW